MRSDCEKKVSKKSKGVKIDELIKAILFLMRTNLSIVSNVGQMSIVVLKMLLKVILIPTIKHAII